jgi:hypothetical protein
VSLESLLIGLLAFAVLPLWLVAGGADWLCHRRTDIERTSGTRESWLHLVEFAQIAIPAIAALFLEMTALLIVACGAAVALHMTTSLLDTTWTQPRRHISPLEQQIHSYLEMLPLFALSLVLVLHAGEWRDPEWRLVAREVPLPRAAVVATLAGFLVALLLIVEELWRCSRAGNCARASDLRVDA